MIQPADVNEFGLIIASASGAPGASIGASVTPGNNTYGSYSSIMSGATVTDDVYGLWIIVNTGFVSGSARDIIITIGLDPAGGTSFSDWITDLAGSCASNYGGATSAGGVKYFFPLFIKAGTAVTVGGASEGAWTSIGTVAAGEIGRAHV